MNIRASETPAACTLAGDTIGTVIRTFRGRRCFLRALVLFGSYAAALLPAVARASSETIASLVDEYESSGRGRIHLSVVRVPSGEQIVSRRKDTPAAPASNQKLLTAAFALARLKSDYRFRTRVYRAGRDLVVAGGWDPTLGDPVMASFSGESIYAPLDAWSAAAANAVGKKIAGDLVICRHFEKRAFRPPAWPRRHHNKWYGAPVAKLNFHDNCYDVVFVGNGPAVRPRVTPASRYIGVSNQTRKGPRHLWSLSESKNGALLTISGRYRTASRDPISVPAEDPPLLLARVFADRLARAGVEIAGGIRLVDENMVRLAHAELIAETATPLQRVLKRACRRSLNLAGECLFLCAGDGTWSGSARIMERVLRREYGLSADHLHVSDGSGLSGENRVTAAAVTKLLAAVQDRAAGRELLACLPRSGEARTTLRNRMDSDRLKGRVAAKTGYVAGVVALSGYILDGGGKPGLAFSILIDRVRGVGAAKSIADRVCAYFVTWLDR